MKIAMVCGTWPPERCGVGDYTDILCGHLESAGAEVVRVRRDGWGAGSLLSYRRQIVASGADILHVQYPSVGYGRSLLPALTPYLGSGRPVVATLHEYEIFKPYRRPWFAPYATRAKARIFSRQAEKEAFARAFPGRRGRDDIVAIGSNIPKADPPPERPKDGVVFFGLFWPGKGLEAFLELGRLLSEGGAGSQRLAIVGAPVAGQEEFAREIRSACSSLGIALHEDLPAAEVAAVLAQHRFAYLPFPGGADERRGSLAATLVNGCIALTTHGPATPDWLQQATVRAESSQDAVRFLTGRARDEAEMSGLESKAGAAADRYDWTAIAARHLEIYADILRS